MFFCGTIDRQRDMDFSVLSTQAADAAIEIDMLERGQPYHDKAVQDFADRIEEILAEPGGRWQWTAFLIRLARDIGVEPSLAEQDADAAAESIVDVIDPFRKRLSAVLGDVLLPGLRNVGSRGAENAARMGGLCLRISRLAMAEGGGDGRMFGRIF